MDGNLKAERRQRLSLAASSIKANKRNAETQRPLRSERGIRGNLRSVSGGFGGGMQAVLRHFVDAAGRRLDALAIEMIERDAALADGVTLLDSHGDVGLGQSSGFEERAAGSELRGERG